MPRIIVAYVRYIDAFNRRLGRMTMYLIFVMIGVLMFSTISKSFFNPSLWTLEIAQFLMVAYFLLGGAYSMQLNNHVRMDLLYGMWSPKTKAWVDVFTVFFLLTYLGVLLYGAYNSTSYSLQYQDRAPTAWRPYMWPIKSVMFFGILMMLLQTVSEFFKDVAKIRGVEL